MHLITFTIPFWMIGSLFLFLAGLYLNVTFELIRAFEFAYWIFAVGFFIIAYEADKHRR